MEFFLLITLQINGFYRLVFIGENFNHLNLNFYHNFLRREYVINT